MRDGRGFCLPPWHGQFAKLQRITIRSGCAVGDDGNVNCAPENMRAAAEAKLRQMGAWRVSLPLPLAAYTLARYSAAETGSGSPEQKMAVILAAIRQAQETAGGDVNRLLLRRQAPGHPNRGFYGPIHGPSGIDSAPYGRWASTSRDPSLDDLLIAAFALSGQAGDFARGADDQYGAKYFGSDRVIEDVRGRKGNGRNYWVGHIPGVNPMETFLYGHFPSVAKDSSTGRALIAQAVQLLDDPRTRAWVAADRAGRPEPTDVPWAAGTDRICSPSVAPKVLAAGAGLALGGGFLWWLFTKAPIGKGLLGRHVAGARRRPLGDVDWLKYADAEAYRKLGGPAAIEIEREAFDRGNGELKLIAWMQGTKVGELEAWSSSDGQFVNVDKIVVGPRGRGVGTKLYDAAAHWACQTARRPLASDEKRSSAAQGFWAKQVRKKRATCVWRLSAEERRLMARELEFTPPNKPAWGRGGCARYALTCPAPKTLAGSRRR